MADRVLRVVNNQVRVSVAGGPLIAALAGQAAATSVLPLIERAEASEAAIQDMLTETGEVQSGASVTYLGEGTGAVVRSMQAKARDAVSVLDFIPVSLHAAIRAYTGPGYDTDHELQTYIQAGIDWCRDKNRTLFFPAGYYRTTATLTVYGDEDTGATALEGENEYGTMIWCANLSADILTNDTTIADFRRLSLRNLSLGRGQWGLRIIRTGGQVASLIHCQNVRFERHGAGAIWVDQYAITWELSNTVFYFCNAGIRCGRNFNNITMIKPRFEGLDDVALDLDSPGSDVNGCEDVTLIAPRFEGRNAAGATGGSVIRGVRMSNFTVLGGYFENTYKRILEETLSLGQVCFKNTHFTGFEADVSPAGFKSPEFDSDGLVTLESCRFVTPTDGPSQQLRVGTNNGISEAVGYYTQYEHSPSFTTRLVTPASSATVSDLILFSRPSPAGPDEPVGGSNQRSLIGELLVGTQAKSSDNVEYYSLIKVPIVVSAFAGGNMTVTLGAPVNVVPAAGITVSVAVKGSPTQTSGGVTVQVGFSNFESVFVRAVFTGLSHQGVADTKILLT